MVLRAAQTRIVPLKAVAPGIANAPDGAFFPAAIAGIPFINVLNLLYLCLLFVGSRFPA